ncbi:MAG: anti-sigma factor family protein, partial [Candidatus Latescibacterota bacterium]
MIPDDLRQKLNDYVDGALSADDKRKVEALLAKNSEAQAEVAFLKQLAQDCAQLPQVMAPKRNLWAGVVNGMGM